MLQKRSLPRFIRSLVVSLVISAASLFSNPAQAVVWENTQTWSPAWETEYQNWIAANMDKDFFSREGWFRDVKTDCADAVYAMRLIFAAQNGLPFVMKDSTNGTGTISNSMSRWDGQPLNQRLRNFLLYIFIVGSTGSLPQDTYPVAVTRDQMTSGSVILTDIKNHHSWTIQSISQTGIPFLLFASRPARVKLYERNEWPSMGFMFPNGLRPERNAGVRAFRQPQDIGKQVWQVPGYSTEQYQIPYDSWVYTMQRRLQLSEETPEGRITRVLSEACKGARERADITNIGWAYLNRVGNRCLNAQEYDDYSTPSRDARMKASFEDLQAAFNDANSRGRLGNASLRAKVQSVLAGEASSNVATAHCPVEVYPGRFLTLGQIYARSLDGRFSNNPHDEPAARWGLQAHPGSLARSCPSF